VTIGELIDELTTIVERYSIPRDAKVLLSVGVLKGIIQRKLKEDAECFPGPVISFIEEPTGVSLEGDEWDDARPVFIHGGTDLEVPPML
jgi:hypothetical protein